MRTTPDGIFKPKLTSGEKKSDVTTMVAFQVVEGERAERDAKTARLRLARLAQEQNNPMIAPAKGRKGKKKPV